MEDIYHHLLVDLSHKSMPHHWQVVQLWGAWLQYLLDPGRWLQHLLHRTWARLIAPTYCSSCVRERVDPPITLDGLHRSSATGVTWMHPTHFIHLCWHIPLYIRLLRSFTLGRLSVSCKVADSVSSHVTKAYLSLKDPFFFLPPIQSSVWWDFCVGCSYHQPFRMHVIFTAVCSSGQLFECGRGRSSQTDNPCIGAVDSKMRFVEFFWSLWYWIAANGLFYRCAKGFCVNYEAPGGCLLLQLVNENRPQNRVYQSVTMLGNAWRVGVTASAIMNRWKYARILSRFFDNMEEEEPILRDWEAQKAIQKKELE